MAHPTQRARSPRAAMPQSQGNNLQRVWDACLLLGFRNRSNLNEVFEIFKLTVGFSANAYGLKLKRLPLPEHMEDLESISVDYFLRNYLQSIYERAFRGRQEFDNILISKIQTWNYDTHPVRLADTSHKKLNNIVDYRDRAGLSNR